MFGDQDLKKYWSKHFCTIYPYVVCMPINKKIYWMVKQKDQIFMQKFFKAFLVSFWYNT
jgi:hypothetical protein